MHIVTGLWKGQPVSEPHVTQNTEVILRGIVKEKFVQLSKVDRVRLYLCYRGVLVPARPLAVVAGIVSSSINCLLRYDIRMRYVTTRKMYAVSSGRFVYHYAMTRKGMQHYAGYMNYLLSQECTS